MKEKPAGEERFRALVQNSSDLITILESDGTITYETPSISRILGYNPEDLLGKNAFDYIHPEDVSNFRGSFNNMIQHPSIAFPVELRFRHVNGSWVNLEAVGNNLINHPGIKGIVVNSRDISERKRAEEARIHLEEQLRQSQKIEVIGRLAGGVAHDFNNLLMAIMGYSELLLLKLVATDPFHREVEEILKAAKHGAALTRQLLAFSRKQIFEPKILDLNNLLKNIQNMLQRLLGEDIDLAIAFDQNLGYIKADSDQIEQIILNIAANARDAMPRAGKITIKTANVELDEKFAGYHLGATPGHYVMLKITDNGCGMDEATLSHIFEPFFTTKEQGRGTGLGLATVYGIVKQSGGYISVQSQPQGGTTFEIYLPRTDSPPEVPESPRSPAPMGSGCETILLVDDNESVRTAIGIMLGMREYAVLQAGHGTDALAISRRHSGPIHLLLTDVVMPRMNGIELAQRLRSDRPEIKVLYLSGCTQEALIDQGFLGRDTVFLPKPASMQTLIRKIRELLDAN